MRVFLFEFVEFDGGGAIHDCFPQVTTSRGTRVFKVVDGLGDSVSCLNESNLSGVVLLSIGLVSSPDVTAVRF